MGSAPDWQKEITKALEPIETGTILNPRRDDWDSSWRQSIDNPQFRQQVEWELEGLERADVILMNFSPGTQSPITLLELGLMANLAEKDIVVNCPEGFWRKGNVDIVCKRYDVWLTESFKDFINMSLDLVKDCISEIKQEEEQS